MLFNTGVLIPIFNLKDLQVHVNKIHELICMWLEMPEDKPLKEEDKTTAGSNAGGPFEVGDDGAAIEEVDLSCLMRCCPCVHM